MDVKLPSGENVRRIFNIRYVKSIDTNSRTILLHGNMKAFTVTERSIEFLLSVLDSDGLLYECK